MTSFAKHLETGRVAESAIAKWLQCRGCSVLPAYEVETGQFKGPQFYSRDQSFATPDMLVFGGREGKALWVEAKHKTGFAWNRQRQVWVTGVDVRNYNDYIAVAGRSNLPVWLLFLQRGGQAKDSPPSPAGLYGQDLEYLTANENHRGMMGTREMVYWAIDSLRKMAEVEDLL